MAVFKHKCAGVEIKINDSDHLPPHCHVLGDRRNIQVDLHTLDSLDGKTTLPGPVRACLEEQQAAMLAAWEKVMIT